ncbi:MAG: serine hydrolase [Ramlibacter sp.]|nr:serine hydrolase [Ramlibacter sp.]
MRCATRFPVLSALLLAACAAWAEPDEELLGKAQGYPVATSAAQWYQMPYRVGSWSAMDQVPGVLTAAVPRAQVPRPLPHAAASAPIRYRFRNVAYSIDDYLERRRVTGLLVLRRGEIVAEHYRYGRQEQARFISFSMAKSVTSLLVGMALERGLIASLDDPAERYAKALEGSAYGQTPLRHLLRMSSGLRFTERYDGLDDMARLSRALATGQPGTVSVLRSIDQRLAPSGEKFAYASAETEVLGRVLTGATGRSIAALTAEWLWQPMGAEHDAFWRIGTDRQEQAMGGFNASLRDWGRLGQLLADDGQVGGRQLLPRAYLMDATDAERQPAAFVPRKATPFWGYGYQFWLFPMRERTFALQGIHGQAVYVQPASGLVMVQTAVYANASGAQEAEALAERNALWLGVLDSLGGRTERY